MKPLPCAVRRLIALLVVALGVVEASAKEAPAKLPLTFAQARSGKGIIQRIVDWCWRPGHADLVRVRTAREKDVMTKHELLAMDPATGVERVLFDLLPLRDAVPKKKHSVAGIGRAGAPWIWWTRAGTAFCTRVRGNLVWVDLAKGSHRVLTRLEERVSDVRVAPDGSAVAFCKDYDQWVVRTDEGDPYPLTTGGSEVQRNAGLDWVYPEELRYRTGTWWAPDGTAVATLQLDETHVPTVSLPRLLGTHPSAQTLRYPKAGDPNPVPRLRVLGVDGRGNGVDLNIGDGEYVASVTWVPDSSRLLVVTLDRAQRRLWMRLCDAKTGESQVLFEEEDEAWLDVPRPPHFVDDHRYLWKTQTTTPFASWVLRSLPDASSTDEVSPDVPLASPDWETLGRPMVDVDTNTAFANVHGYPKYDYVLTIDLSRSDPERARKSLVDQAVAASVRATWNDAATHALVTWSSPDQPPTTAVMTRDGKELRKIGSGKGPHFDSVAWARAETGTFHADDLAPHAIHWRLFRPADFDARKRYPLIVHTYGGPGTRMVFANWTRRLLWTTYLTQRGFVVAHIDGRGGGGRSRAFARSVRGRLGRPEIDDQARVALELAKRRGIDGSRIGIWGWSYGGTMACNGVIFRSDVFKAAVAVAPVTDWRLYDTIYTERYMGRPQDNAKGYDDTSSLKAAKNLNGHLLLMHGLSDDNVHAQNTYQLAEALLKAKKTTFDVMTYADKGHGIGGAAHDDVYRRMLAWFERHLEAER